MRTTAFRCLITVRLLEIYGCIEKVLSLKGKNVIYSLYSHAYDNDFQTNLSCFVSKA